MSFIPQCLVLDGGWRTLADAEDALRERMRELPIELACTHFVPGSRVVMTVTPAAGARDAGTWAVRDGQDQEPEIAALQVAAPEVAAPEVTAPEIAALLQQHMQRRSGRAVVFPGSEALIGRLSVAEVLARSAIDMVVLIGGGPAAPDDILDTQEHVRPEFVDGRLVLRTRPAAGGVLVPFEQPSPTPCCAAHADSGAAHADSGAAHAD